MFVYFQMENNTGVQTRQIIVNGQQATIKTEPNDGQTLISSPNSAEQKQGNKFVVTPDYIQQSEYLVLQSLVYYVT